MGERTDPLSGEQPSTTELRRDIAHTQREMSHTIDEIQYRLSPDHLKAEARETLRSARMRTTRGTIDRVKSNPLGAAMVGVGLYLLMRRPDDDDYGMDYGMELSGSRSYSPQTDYRDYDFDRGTGETAGLRDRAGDVAGNVRDRASETLGEASDRARMLRDRAAYGARSASMRGRDLMMDNPLVGGLAAVAVGAILGALLPETDRENELLGRASDRVTDRIEHVARTGAEQAKNIVTTAASAAKDAATDAARRETANAKNELSDELGRV
jgi:ElaB/YqjD/DUF883 family membrane-anchored ribosome-binding protein